MASEEEDPLVGQAWRWDATLENWRNRLATAARRTAFREAPDLAAAALEIEAGRFRSSGIPHLFAPDLIQIPPTLNDDLLELYGRSEQALANCYGFFGKTTEFGREVEWENHPSAAWRAELHSFDYALDLALTYRISGDARYARHLRYLIAHWISSNLSGQTFGWNLPPLARRVRNWILAADLARADWERDPDFPDLIVKSLGLQIAFLSWQTGSLGARHDMLLCSRALLLASRLFEGGGRLGLEEKAHALLHTATHSDSGPSNVPQEAQPPWQYQLCATLLDHALFTPEGGRRRTDWLFPQLRQSLEILESMLLPDGTLPLFGQETPPSAEALSGLFALGAVLCKTSRWKALGGEFGILPYMLMGESGKARFDGLPAERWRADSRLYARSGIYRMSDGRESALVINAQGSSSAESHNDPLSYELVIGGQRTVVDSGAFSPPGDPSEDYFSSAGAHNVLLIDGHGPRPHTFVAPKARPLEGIPDTQGLWFQERGFEPLGISHQRIFALIENLYWLVLDCLGGKGVHELQSLLHFYPAFVVEACQNRAFARSGAASATVLPLSTSGTHLIVTARGTGNPQGWYSPAVGVMYPSAVLALTWSNVRLPWVGGYVITAGKNATIQARMDSTSEFDAVVNLDGTSTRFHSPTMWAKSPKTTLIDRRIYLAAEEGEPPSFLLGEAGIDGLKPRWQRPSLNHGLGVLFEE